MKKEKTRSEIEEKYKWDLTSLYKDEKAFDKDINEVNKLLKEIKNYKGKLTKSSENLYNYLKLDERITVLIENLYVYASAKYNEDVSISENLQRQNEVLNLDALFSEYTSFMKPELMKTDYKTIEKYINENDKLKEFKFDLEYLYRFQKYILSDNEELLLSKIIELNDKYKINFQLLTNSLIDFGIIKDENNQDVELTIGNYSKYIKSKDRRVRMEAFNNMFSSYNAFKNTFASLLKNNVKSNFFISRTRSYK